MKNVNAVRWTVLLVALLANADVAETKMMVDRPTSRPRARCERCGETGPTVPIAPVVFRVRPMFGFKAPQGPGNGNLRPAVRFVLPNSTLPMRDEFGLDSASPAVGGAVTR